MTTARHSGAEQMGSSERGFSLTEVIVATVIAVIAVLGLASSFGTGRALINRYEASRSALSAADGRLEMLARQAARNTFDPDVSPGAHPMGGPQPVFLSGQVTGNESWQVEWVNDPVDDNPNDPTPRDYKRATVTITWTQGAGPDSVQLSRTLPGS